MSLSVSFWVVFFKRSTSFTTWGILVFSQTYNSNSCLFILIWLKLAVLIIKIGCGLWSTPACAWYFIHTNSLQEFWKVVVNQDQKHCLWWGLSNNLYCWTDNRMEEASGDILFVSIRINLLVSRYYYHC